MKKTITKLAIFLGLTTALSAGAQTTLTFDSFTLAADTFYEEHTGADWQSGVAKFRYDWTIASWGNYWSGGSAYTNKTDTINMYNGSYYNTYSNITGLAYSGSNYVTLQDQAIITFSNTSTAVSGFYITNTTWAWKTIKKGDSFSRKFGDTTGTGSGTSIPQGEYPDWFKVSVVGYQDGNAKTDTVHYYLADYRAAGTTNDYVIKNWQFVNCSALGEVDSIQFVMKSSDSGQWGMNTPAFFSIDNLITSSTVGINELGNIANISVYPNPTNGNVSINYTSSVTEEIISRIYDVAGKEILISNHNSSVGNNRITLNAEHLEAGVYFIKLSNETSTKEIKFIKL
jgi:hypothetical protein